MTRTTDGKPTAQLDLFDNIMRNDMNSNTDISEKTTDETSSPMKDSGIEWIGEIPKEWNIVHVSRGFTNRKELAGTKENTLPRLALTLRGVIQRSKFDANGLQPSNFSTYQILRKDELVFKLIDLENFQTSRVGLCPFEIGMVSPAYIVLKPNGTILPEYAHYYFLMMWRNRIFNGLGSDGVRSSLGVADLLKVPIVLPPLSEQVAIASRLDSITSRIDESVRLIDEQLADLKDYRKALISEVVTRGVPSDSTPQPTKPTNTKWIPTIPTHWKTQRGKNCLILLNRPVRNDDDVITAFRDGTVTLRTNRRTEGFTFSDKEIGYQGIEPGDLVIHGMDAFAGTLGISDSRGKGSPILIVIDSSHNKDYLRYQLLTMAWYGVFTATATGIRVRSCDLRWNKLANMTFILPPRDEQTSIVRYLNQRLVVLSHHEETLSRQRDDLLAYRQSVISEYVTGKRRV